MTVAESLFGPSRSWSEFQAYPWDAYDARDGEDIEKHQTPETNRRDLGLTWG